MLNLGQAACPIISKKAFQQYGQVVACGAYTLEAADDRRIVLKAFKDFYLGEPLVDTIELIADTQNIAESFTGKEYDFIRVEDDAVYKAAMAVNAHIDVVDMIAVYYMGFNMRSSHEIVKNRDARQALNHAINKERIIKEALGVLGTVASSPLPASMLGGKTIKPYEYDPEKAKRMLKQSGIKNFNITLAARDGSGGGVFAKTLKYILEDLEAVGFHIKVTDVTTSEFIEKKVFSTHDVFISRWIGDNGDPDNFLEPLFNPDNVSNMSGYNNNEIVTLMGEAKKLLNPTKRLEVYQKISQLLHQEAPWVYLFHPKLGVAYHAHLAGMNLNSRAIIRYDQLYLNK